jgi:hypothetical protein
MAEHDIPGPDWSTAPSWAKWWATDKTGPWWYARKPTWTVTGWDPNFGNCWLAPQLSGAQPGDIFERPGGTHD